MYLMTYVRSVNGVTDAAGILHTNGCDVTETGTYKLKMYSSYEELHPLHFRVFVHPPTHSLLSSPNERYRHLIVLLTVYWKFLPVNHTIWHRIIEILPHHELERMQKYPVIIRFWTVCWNLSREAEEIDWHSQSMVVHALCARRLQQDFHIRVCNILYCHFFISKAGFQVTKQILLWNVLLHRTWEIVWFIFLELEYPSLFAKNPVIRAYPDSAESILQS
jgi:hypothetical protein